MPKEKIRALWLAFRDIFNLKDEEAKGRTITLSSNILTGLYNIFITGIFYTGFLTMYDMSITDAGIITFIPFIANLFGIFSGKILSHFPRPKKILLGAKLAHYTLFIIATTLMPLFVTEPGARITCFCVILFCAYAVYAPFSPGITAWMYNFYPKDNDRRARYIMLLQIFSSVLSSLTMLFSSILADMLEDSPYQNQLILVLRYVAFALVLIELFFQSRAKEFPSTEDPNLKLREVFTLSFRYPKFMACMALLFFWNFMGNFGGGVWNYHLLNHMHFSYTTINIVNVLYTPVLLLLSPFWQKVLRRYSWIKTFGIAVLCAAPTDLIFFFMTPERGYMFIPVCVVQHIVYVGISLAISNVLYMNLPSENTTTHIVFNTIGTNIFMLLGMALGTWISSLSGDSTFSLLGMEMYSVQFNALLKGILMVVLGLLCILKWRVFTNDRDIAEIERRAALRKKRRV